MVDPELGVSIFRTSLGLLILDILGYTQTGQFNLRLDVSEGQRSRASYASLEISSQQITEMIVKYIVIHFEETVIPDISFFHLLCPPSNAFPARMISLATDVTANFTLSRIITWAAICIDLETHLRS